MSATRIERDPLGELPVPEDALFGIQTERARRNFPISHLAPLAPFVDAVIWIKKAAALTHRETKRLDAKLADAIVRAADEVLGGRHRDQFVVDPYQAGAGTSHNMNCNEVLANRANELLGGTRGTYQPVHPNDHVNMAQSTNDVIPTAIRLAALAQLPALLDAMGRLARAFLAKGKAFDRILKSGRTHLQDATPIRLGQEFLGYAGQVARGLKRLQAVRLELGELPLGGTAVGTGVTAHPEFAERVCSHLARRTGMPVKETDNHFQAQASLDTVLSTSGALRTIAASLWKVGNDIRWFGSGPRAGLGELALPEVQPGSSIMPGKVNPVIIESALMVVAEVLGNDATIAVAAQAGSIFELNLMMPVAAYNLLQSIGLLARAAENLAKRCIDGLRATDHGPAMVEQGLMLATALAPAIGYDAAAKIAKEALTSGKTVREIARQRAGLKPEELDRLLDPARMTEPGLDAGGSQR